MVFKILALASRERHFENHLSRALRRVFLGDIPLTYFGIFYRIYCAVLAPWDLLYLSSGRFSVSFIYAHLFLVHSLNYFAWRLQLAIHARFKMLVTEILSYIICSILMSFVEIHNGNVYATMLLTIWCCSLVLSVLVYEYEWSFEERRKRYYLFRWFCCS